MQAIAAYVLRKGPIIRVNPQVERTTGHVCASGSAARDADLS